MARVRNGGMKLPLRLVLFSAAFCLLAPTSDAQGWMESYNRLLGKYATSGGVKYAEWKSNAGDMQALQAVVDGIAKENASGMERSSSSLSIAKPTNAGSCPKRRRNFQPKAGRTRSSLSSPANGSRSRASRPASKRSKIT